MSLETIGPDRVFFAFVARQMNRGHVTEAQVLAALGCTRFRFKSLSDLFGCPYSNDAGARDLMFVGEIVAYQQKWHYGYKRCASGLANHNVRVARQEVEQVYTARKLFSYKLKLTVKHTKRFVAKYVGMTCHTDLHFVDPLPPSVDPRQYLIAFIDDRSRYVIHSEMLPDKTMAGTAQALENALAIGTPPL
jgi:hypothetical protein